MRPSKQDDLVPEIRTVALYGNSLVVSSIGASLQGRAGLQVVPLDAAQPDAPRQLSALQPDIIIFDLAAAQPDFAITLWKARPHTLLIGIDLATGRALALSGQASRALITDDLLQVIESHADGLEQENVEVTAHVSLRPRKKRRDPGQAALRAPRTWRSSK